MRGNPNGLRHRPRRNADPWLPRNASLAPRQLVPSPPRLPHRTKRADAALPTPPPLPPHLSRLDVGPMAPYVMSGAGSGRWSRVARVSLVWLPLAAWCAMLAVYGTGRIAAVPTDWTLMASPPSAMAHLPSNSPLAGAAAQHSPIRDVPDHDHGSLPQVLRAAEEELDESADFFTLDWDPIQAAGGTNPVVAAEASRSPVAPAGTAAEPRAAVRSPADQPTAAAAPRSDSTRPVALAAPAETLHAPLGTAERCGERMLDTALVWAQSPREASLQAKLHNKLVFLIQVSGNFEIPEFT